MQNAVQRDCCACAALIPKIAYFPRVPYRSATQSGIVQIAFNFDSPVILTDVGGLAEVVRPGELGEVVPPRDPAALAAAVIDYFQEGKEAEYTPRVAEEKKRYTWAAQVEALEGFVRGV